MILKNDFPAIISGMRKTSQNAEPLNKGDPALVLYYKGIESVYHQRDHDLIHLLKAQRHP